MKDEKRLTKVFANAEVIPFSDSSRIVLMSDCHRGDGSWADNLAQNQNLYFTALQHYFNERFTYIELGDGDELWENKHFSDIMHVHSDDLLLLSQFYAEGRLYLIYGNHDMAKKSPKFVRDNLYFYYDEREQRQVALFDQIKTHEGLVLKQQETGGQIFLVHGHQADFLNYDLWRISQFLVRHLWKPLQLIGVRDPTSTSKNTSKKDAVEKNLIRWIKNNRQMLVAGHTHRPVFPKPGEPPYFNDGCCVNPWSVTALEIAKGNISLVKWCVRTKFDGTLFVKREVTEGPKRLRDYFELTDGLRKAVAQSQTAGNC